MTVETQ